MARKKKEPRHAPVETGHDRRAEKGRPPRPGRAEAPDGVSGRWP